MTFANWIDTFISEKGIGRDVTITAQGAMGANVIPVGILIDAIKAAPERERIAIKGTLVKIDFRAPGRKPVLDYLTHLGQAIAI